MDSWSNEDYSRHVREASMVVDKLPEVNPPSGRVPGRGLWRSRSRKRYGGGMVEKFTILDISLGFSVRGVNIGQRRAPGGGPAAHATWWHGKERACARCSPG
ncbi:hypothetical protein D1007_02311 [Hordeum vulgare]|nr:hypothetical protein D1007_02311 [Hordeum vulgare]